jgi:hypothetical protein
MDFILAFTYKKTIILLLALLAPALTHESCSSITSFTLCDVLAGPGVPGGPWNSGHDVFRRKEWDVPAGGPGSKDVGGRVPEQFELIFY